MVGYQHRYLPIELAALYNNIVIRTQNKLKLNSIYRLFIIQFDLCCSLFRIFCVLFRVITQYLAIRLLAAIVSSSFQYCSPSTTMSQHRPRDRI